MKLRWLAALGVLALILGSCSSASGSEETTTAGEVVENTTMVTAADDSESHEQEGPVAGPIVAPEAAIVVDGDISDWVDVPSVSLTMSPIEEREGDDIEPKDVTIQMAHDADNVYMLFAVEDDYNWSADDGHLSGSVAMEFQVDTGGPHMGATDDAGDNSAGMVDIWHWELECPAGELAGGAINPPGDGDPGNDSVCNFDDEWATDAETREDDNSATAENSLTGTWWHSNPTDDAEGTWYFEVSRPLQTGDENDAQFEAGESALLALAYWDADFSADGWDDSTHVTSAEPDWITVDFE